jgi:hypothetical protein
LRETRSEQEEKDDGKRTDAEDDEEGVDQSWNEAEEGEEEVEEEVQSYSASESGQLVEENGKATEKRE